MSDFFSFTWRTFWIRIRHWEYWSFTAIYIWIYPVWFLLCLRARSFFFFAAANPGIRNGGFLNESKKDILPQLPAHLYPPTLFFRVSDPEASVLEAVRQHLPRYPLIGKPNIGGRGRGVKLLQGETELRQYICQAAMDYHIQEYISFEEEVGIFYCRMPGSAHGQITGIVEKQFLRVTGDGRKTLRQLILANERASMYQDSLWVMHAAELDQVLPAGALKLLSPYGNHARGATFLDASHRIDHLITHTIDRVCQQMPDFYYGRLDIRYRSWEQLRKGEDFYIIEVNGAGSEPTHMYDPSYTLFRAWKEIIRHWVLLLRISRINHRAGHPYLPFREGCAMFLEDRMWSRKLAAMPL